MANIQKTCRESARALGKIIDDSIQERNEQFSVKLRDSTVLINPIAEVIMKTLLVRMLTKSCEYRLCVFLLVIDNCTVALDRPIAVTATSAYYTHSMVWELVLEASSAD